MAQVINTNSISLVAQNNLNKSQSSLGTAIERLSSGLRINSAKDYAAGQAIANRFTSNINGLTQASRNANDGISLAQTTEGALDQINGNLQAVRTLTVQAQTGTNSASDLQSIQDEVNQRLAEVNRISDQTYFNGVKVLSADKSLNIQVGSDDGQTISIALKKTDASTLGLATFNVNGAQGQTSTVKAATAAFTNGTAATGTYAAPAGTVKLSDLTGLDVSGVTDDTQIASSTVTGFKDSSGTAIAGGSLVVDSTGAAFISTTSAGTTTLYKVASISADGATVTASALATDKTTGTMAAGTFTKATANPPTVSNLAAVTTGTAVTLGETLADGTTNQTSATTAASLTFKDASGATVTGGTLVSDGTNTYVKTATALYSAASISSDGATVTLGNKTAGTFAANATTAANSDFTATAAASSVNGTAVTSITINDASGTNMSADTLVQDKNQNYFVQDAKGVSYAATVAIDSTTGAATVSVDSTKAIANAATNDSLATLDKALSSVDTMRSNLGAVQNRFDSTISNLASTTTNLSQAQSRIQDADYATEVSNMSKAQILQQAGTSVLAQANQVPQTVLSLLK